MSPTDDRPHRARGRSTATTRDHPLLAALYDPLLRPAESGALGGQRARLLRGVTGHVVDIGAGTGANLPHLLGHPVTHYTAIEPSAAMRRRLGRRVGALAPSFPVSILDARAERLPLPDGDVDVALATLTLCTVDDPQQAAAELRRVLRPTGHLVVLEHVRATTVLGRGLQRAAEPGWRRAAGGCRLTRDTWATLAAAGFDVAAVEGASLMRTGPLASVITGLARPR